MRDKDLKTKIDKQIKNLIEKIDSNVSKEEIKETQIILNGLLKEYSKEKKWKCSRYENISFILSVKFDNIISNLK